MGAVPLLTLPSKPDPWDTLVSACASRISEENVKIRKGNDFGRPLRLRGVRVHAKLQKFAFKSPVHACDSNSGEAETAPAAQGCPEPWRSNARKCSWSCGVGSRTSGWQQLLKNDTCYFIGGTL